MTVDARILGLDMARGRHLPFSGQSPRVASGDLWKGLRVEEVAIPSGGFPETTPVNHIVYRHFKQATGMPPHQYVLRRRIERARSLLADTGISLVEIVLRCGFSDRSSFSTAFRQWTRLTPGGYRKTLS